MSMASLIIPLAQPRHLGPLSLAEARSLTSDLKRERRLAQWRACARCRASRKSNELIETHAALAKAKAEVEDLRRKLICAQVTLDAIRLLSLWPPISSKVH
jgi:hypothetical protein